MTDLAVPTTDTVPAPPRAASALLFGLLSGFLLGVLARAWMRLITEDPEFTWNGTMFIVIGFTFFGLTQAVATLAARRGRRRWLVRAGRVVGIMGILPLFGAAGAFMAPTVIGGGFAVARPEWTRAARASCLAVAAVPVLLITGDLIDAFGWSLHALAGLVGLLAIYGAVVVLAGATFSRSQVSRPLNMWVSVAVVVVACGSLGFMLIGAGG
jgi:hypothetical protein